jgi:hypothetical protein
MAIMLSGCQTTSMKSNTTSVDSSPTSKIYFRTYQSNQTAADVTFVSKGEPLQRAIRHAFPDAPIKADSGIDLHQRLDVWAEDLPVNAYLTYLGNQVNAVISLSGSGEIELRSVDQWQFMLAPGESAGLMPQAIRLADRAGIEYLQMGLEKNILLLSGDPASLQRVRRALNQLSDRILLERTLQPMLGSQS